MQNSSGSADGMFVDGHGVVTFGKGSLTQITPDLESTDTLPVTSSAQSVGTLKVNAAQLHMEEDSLVYLPSGL
ncbi:hypothetical protein, partial [Rheinheimera maricola]|uniref:hypothetical protein n=1 Tax=Rheinheimera maricola TaxID=2793282 RepID=UPI0019634D89